MLKISFLGKFKIQYKEEDITDKVGVKTIALLALLVLQENREICREKVIAYLWPDSNEDAAKYNLRYNMWLLKKLIPTDENGESFLRIDKDFCGINFNYSFKCDLLQVLEFNNFNEYSVETLIELKDSFKGDFFEGIYFNNCDEFNEIIIFQRNKLENFRIKILRKLANAYELKGMNEEYLETINEVFNIDPYDEKLALKALSVYVKSGNRYGAIKFYKDFSKRIIYTLGIQPSQLLQDKYKEIKNEGRCEATSKNDEKIVSKSIPKTQIIRMNVKIKIIGIKAINYFGISEIIDKLIEEKIINKHISVHNEYIEDLAYISQDLVKCCEVNFDRKAIIPDARIVKGFLKLMDELNKTYYIEIKVDSIEELDESSKEILRYLQKLKIIKMEE